MSDDASDSQVPGGERGASPSDPGPPSRASRASPDRETVSWLDLANFTLRHRGKFVGLPVLAVVLALALTLPGPETYTSETSFMPQLGAAGGGQLSGLSGLATRYGIDIPSQGTEQSPQFYRDLLNSRRILRGAVESDYRIVEEGDTLRGTLVDLFGVEASDATRRRKRAVHQLASRLSARVDRESGIVELSVTTGSPPLSKAIAERLLELVNEFNVEVRQSQAAAQTDFVEGRLEVARRELRAAEDSLERFLERNRSFQNSPTLRFEHQRLQRRVDLEQQVYTSLATRYEEAQIAEVHDTPVITVVTTPDLPATPDSKHLSLKILVALLLGGLVALLWALGRESSERLQRDSPEQYREFLELRASVTENLRRGARTLRRAVSGLLR